MLIVGQDPYPTPGHAMGLSFSGGPDVRPVPRCLRNIFTELGETSAARAGERGPLGVVRQGVMLLNRVLTVRPGDARLAPRQGLGGGHRARDPGPRRPRRPAGRRSCGDATRGRSRRCSAGCRRSSPRTRPRCRPAGASSAPGRSAASTRCWSSRAGARRLAAGVSELRSVTVFCGSSPGARPSYLSAATALGTTLAERGLRLVYGGASVGLMGAVADATLAAGGEVVGVIPQHLVDREVAHPGLSDLQVTGSMHQAQAALRERGAEGGRGREVRRARARARAAEDRHAAQVIHASRQSTGVAALLLEQRVDPAERLGAEEAPGGRERARVGRVDRRDRVRAPASALGVATPEDRRRAARRGAPAPRSPAR